MAKTFYVTTPIYYVNDAPHIGHAYTTVAGDVLTRWHRLRGEAVWFLTGTDEHGQKVLRTAQANETAPKQWCDRLVENAWKPVWSDLNIANDDFIRTTEPRHVIRVQRFLQSLMESGYIYEGRYEGPYCVGCEEFKLESDLEEGNCKIHGKPAEIISETNWFFKLSAFTEKLLKRYKGSPDTCEPESARNEVIAFLEGGVQDLSISRSSFSWGIPVPWDEKQVVYVWFDALLNYATAVGLGESSDSELGKKFEDTWPASVHLVGKDILRFHAVIWPAMLLAAGLELPEKIFAHGWLLVGGEKMSKSKLTGIAPADITSHFGVDAFRYYFLRAIPFGSDGSFSWEDMSARYTSELANDFGNLASRTIAMIEKYTGGKVPSPTKANELSELLSRVVVESDSAFGQLDFQNGINSIMSFCKRVNGFITEREPWVVAKEAERGKELEEILYNTIESLRALAILLYPLMPSTCEKLWKSIGAEVIGQLKDQRLDQVAKWGQLPLGSEVKKLDPLFPRLEERNS